MNTKPICGFRPGKSGNPSTQFQPGQSGNPHGRSKLQREFDEALTQALITENPVQRAQELAEIAWKAARKGEAWAVNLLFARLSPQSINVRLSRGQDDDDPLDYGKLTEQEIHTIEAIFERQALTSGEGTT